MASDLVERLRHCSKNTRDEYLHELTGRAAIALTEAEAKLVKAREAMGNIEPYLVWAVSAESPGWHPTMPSAVAEFSACLAELENG